MKSNDSISDFFTRIRNASCIRHKKVVVPFTKINKSLTKILARHGFIQGYKQLDKYAGNFLELTLKYGKKTNQSAIFQIKRLSRPGCRLYIDYRNIPLYKGQGIVFLSTSKGILSDQEAVYLKVGGEILGSVS